MERTFNRKEYNKSKYNSNKEYYKKKVVESRQKKKIIELQKKIIEYQDTLSNLIFISEYNQTIKLFSN